MCDDNGILPFF